MTAIPDSDLLRNSVTKEDARLFATQGRALYLNLPSTGGLWGINDLGPLPPELPAPWSRYADRWLSATLLAETMWAAAVQKAITKRTARGWTVKDAAKSERRTSYAQNLLLQSQNRAGWVSFMTRTLRDFILCDNGAVSEIIRSSSAAGSRIIGIQHLDSMRVWRTGDSNWPIIYEDLLGGMHPMRDYQVMSFVDMESPRAEARGTGICAARRAYQTIYYAMVLQQYGSEKVSGHAPKEVHLVNGIDITQWDDATTTAQEERRQRGNRRYQGVVVVPLLKMDATPDGYRIPIAEIPEGWNAKEERDNIYLLYAAALGMSAQSLKPLSGQGLGTGAQSTNLDEAEKEEGLASFDKQWEHQIDDRVFPTSTTFTWTAHDLKDQQIKAGIEYTKAQTREIMVTKIGEITAAQSAQLAADSGAIPDSMLPSDETPTDELTDSEKPDTPDAEDAPVVAAVTPVAQPAAPVVAGKATIPYQGLDDWINPGKTMSDEEMARQDVFNIVRENNGREALMRLQQALDAGTLALEPTIVNGKITEMSLVPVTKARRMHVADLDAAAALKAAEALVAEVRG